MQEAVQKNTEQIPDLFINSTYFIMPFCFDDYAKLTGALDRSSDWDIRTVKIDYLLSYASRIAEMPGLFRQYALRNPEQLPVSSYRGQLMKSVGSKPGREGQVEAFESFLSNICLAEVLISCFETGIGFLEFKVEYGSLPVDCIIDFSYCFKNMRNKTDEGKENLYGLALKLLDKLEAGRSVIPFFYCASDMKRECLCYHMLKLNSEEREDGKLNQRLYWLGRSYATSFAAEQADAEQRQSRYDFRYSPYSNDNWCGSQEAFANLNYEVGDPKQNWFLRTYKYPHLTKDYHFLYLLILNQRFSAIRYVEQIIDPERQSKGGLKELNRKIIRLKTVFSLRVISNDMLYQNVYNRMYEIMDIDQLLGDLQDNEQQIELQQKETAEKFEYLIQVVLVAISVLAIFSALVDAANYFEIFPAPTALISLVIVSVVILAAFLFWFHRKK